MVLRHTAGDVRVVVLNSDFALNLRGESHLGAHVTGMQIIRSYLWSNLEEVLHIGKRFLKKAHGFVVFKIADMLAEDRVTAFCEAKCVLQFPSKSQHLLHLDSQIDCLGHEPARAAQYAFAS